LWNPVSLGITEKVSENSLILVVYFQDDTDVNQGSTSETIVKKVSDVHESSMFEVNVDGVRLRC
jgi:hypothetical protein